MPVISEGDKPQVIETLRLRDVSMKIPVVSEVVAYPIDRR